MWAENPLDLFRLATLVMSDPIPDKVDSIYLYGQTPDNETSILEGGLALYQSGVSEKLGLCGGGPYIPPGAPPDAPVAYSGWGPWSDWLVEHGVKRGDIYVVPVPAVAHTGSEAYRLVHLAKACDWKTLCVVANPMHMLRAFVCTVSIAVRDYPELLIYAKPGTPFFWGEDALSSQGNVRGPRLEVGMEAEWIRLNKSWGNKYDVTTPGMVMEYVRRREARRTA